VVWGVLPMINAAVGEHNTPCNTQQKTCAVSVSLRLLGLSSDQKRKHLLFNCWFVGSCILLALALVGLLLLFLFYFTLLQSESAKHRALKYQRRAVSNELWASNMMV
jgi:uncharacterized membrane protein